jgi:hypothetical protein
MSDGALVVTWGQAVRGREHQALEVFGEALAYYARLQAAGEIESFEPIALEPGGGTLAGLMVIRGDPEKLSRLRGSDEFLRLNNRTLHIVDNFGVHTGFLGQRLQQLYADWGTQSAALGAGQATNGTPSYAPA